MGKTTSNSYPLELPFALTETTVQQVNEITRKYALDPKKRTVTATKQDTSPYPTKTPVGYSENTLLDLQQYIIGTGNTRNLEIDFGIISTNDITMSLELYNSTKHTFNINKVYISKGVKVSYNIITNVLQPKLKGVIELTAHKMVGLDNFQETIFIELQDENDNILKVPVLITGTRVKLAPTTYLIEPDKNSYTEELYFYTRIFASITGIETRKNLMTKGKYKCNYSVTIQNKNKVLLLLNELIKEIRMTVYQPLWNLNQPPAQVNTGNYKKIYIKQGTENLFNTNEYVAIYKGNDIGYLAKIVSIGSGVLTIESNIKMETLDFLIMPTRLMQVTNAVNVDIPTQHSTKVQISVKEL